MPEHTEKVIIIGSGPAAWTAAIYAARANLKPLVIEGAISEENRMANTLPGGQLSLTTEVENYPGFPHGVDGTTLVQSMREQAIRFGTRVDTEDAIAVTKHEDGFSVEIARSGGNRAWYDTNALIVATGASAKYLGVFGEDRFKNYGVSACAVCDGALPRFRDKPVAVVGGGDTACEEANYLSKYASNVLMFVRGTKLRASKVMADRTLANPKISVLFKTQVVEVKGDEQSGVTGVAVDSVDDEEGTYNVSGLFAAIGHQPNTKFIKTKADTQIGEEGVIVDAHGYIVTGRNYGFGFYKTNTNVEGIFAAGDVADPHYRQAITAAGQGCMAALDVERYLAGKGVH